MAGQPQHVSRTSQLGLDTAARVCYNGRPVWGDARPHNAGAQRANHGLIGESEMETVKLEITESEMETLIEITNCIKDITRTISIEDWLSLIEVKGVDREADLRNVMQKLAELKG